MNMRIRKSLAALCGAVILVLATSVGSHATASRTYLTFSTPVSLPGVTLGSGSYLFERVGNSQDMVRVTNRDNHIVYLTAFTIEINRPPGAVNDIVFGESPSGTPRPIRAWFPEHSRTGREFIYR
jgi:hypothetical protein